MSVCLGLKKVGNLLVGKVRQGCEIGPTTYKKVGNYMLANVWEVSNPFKHRVGYYSQ